MSRLDPHAGKYPPRAPRVVQPGTPEHSAWSADQARKRQAAEARFLQRGQEIGRPVFWRR